jgi:NADPH:quinone reductase-like Zn-dependent oxidoreductase
MILGGSGNVGQFAVQTAKLCGYHVLATCSSSNESGVKHNGADATLDYKLDLETQLKHVKSITGGNLIAVYDTSAQAAAAGLQFLDKASTAEKRAFATTGDWAPLDLPKNVTSSTRVLLGPIGRGTELDKEIAGFVPYVERYLVEGKLRPAEVKVVEGGLEAVPEAVEMAGRNPGKKVVVHVADP